MKCIENLHITEVNLGESNKKLFKNGVKMGVSLGKNSLSLIWHKGCNKFVLTDCVITEKLNGK